MRFSKYCSWFQYLFHLRWLVQANTTILSSLPTFRRIVWSYFGPMIHEESFGQVFEERKASSFPTRKTWLQQLPPSSQPHKAAAWRVKLRMQTEEELEIGWMNLGVLWQQLSSTNPLGSLPGLHVVRKICFFIVWVSFSWDLYYLQQKRP